MLMLLLSGSSLPTNPALATKIAVAHARIVICSTNCKICYVLNAHLYKGFLKIENVTTA